MYQLEDKRNQQNLAWFQTSNTYQGPAQYRTV